MKTVKIYEDGWWCHRINGRDVVEWYPAGTSIEVDDVQNSTVPQTGAIMSQIAASAHKDKFPLTQGNIQSAKDYNRQQLDYDWTDVQYW